MTGRTSCEDRWELRCLDRTLTSTAN